MKLVIGLSNPRDPILADIIAAAKDGHYDKRRDDGPSTLEQTPTIGLYVTVTVMSPQRRVLYLGQLGRMRGEERLLSGGKRASRTKKLLS